MTPSGIACNRGIHVARQERRLAAIVSADVVGYSRLMGVDEAGTLATMQTHRRELWNPTIEAHSGRVVGTAGDSLLIEYGSAVDAVEGAIAVQQGMVQRTADLAEDERMQLRIGINIGEVIVDGDDIFGDGVNVAARLQGIAAPGGIAISGNVHEQVAGKLDVSFADDGAHEVKNIAQAVRVWRWSPDGITPTEPAAVLSASAGGKPSIAVLPFDNMSGDPEQEYFSDGIAEDLITALSKFHWFLVIARNSSFTYKGQAVDVKQVAQDLGVRYVVEGSVRKAGNRVRVTAQLIDCESGAHVWAERYDRDLDDIFAVQDEITTNITAAVGSEFAVAEMTRAQKTAAKDLTAWDLSMRAGWRLGKTNAEDNAEALKLLQQAIAIDSKTAQYHGWLANVYITDAMHGWARPSPESVMLAVQVAREAFSLDGSDELALSTLGMVKLFAGQHDDAIATLTQAVELNPNFAAAFGSLASAYGFCGDYDAGAEALDTALRLSPRDPAAQFWKGGTMVGAFAVERYDEAKAMARDVRRDHPHFVGGYRMLAACHGLLGEEAEAREALAGLLKLLPDLTGARVRTQLPFKDPAALERYVDGLIKAGLPAA